MAGVTDMSAEHPDQNAASDLGQEATEDVSQWVVDAFSDSVDEAELEALARDSAQRAHPQAPDAAGMPVVAIVGRPNVGKSTLVNRLIGRREAVVEDVAGVTRDRVSYPANWAGRDFLVMDTGGWLDKARGMSARIAAQAEVAVASADLVVMVVDATVGATDEDEAVVRMLRRAKLPVILVANKVDDARTEAEAAALWSLGLGEPHPLSALHGRGAGDLLDNLVAALPAAGAGRTDRGPASCCPLGRPNVGKSSLLNRLAGQERSVVDDTAGTTVDPVDEIVEIQGREWVFVDTAGIRRRAKTASGQEYYASLRTRSAVQRAEVALVLLERTNESLNKTCGSSRWPLRRAGRWCWGSTSGISLTTNVGTTCGGRSSEISRMCGGPRGAM